METNLERGEDMLAENLGSQENRNIQDKGTRK